jgi:hypothetical protein
MQVLTMAIKLSRYEIVVALMTDHLSDCEMQTIGCNAVQALATTTRGASQASNAGACAAVTAAMIKHNNNAEVAVESCNTLVKFLYDFGVQKKVIEAGACKAIVECMRLHVTNVQVTQCACDVASEMAEKSDVVKDSLIEAGACEAIVGCLKVDAADAQVAKFACIAVRSMAGGVGAPARLAAAGAYEAVLDALEKHYATVEAVVEACKAIGTFAKYKLVEAGACEAIVTCMRKHSNDAQVAPIGCEAISCLAGVCSAQVLRAAGACEAVVDALFTHRAIEAVVIKGYNVITRLAEHYTYCGSLCTAGVCEGIVDVMVHNATNAEVAESACEAIRQIAYWAQSAKMDSILGQSAKMDSFAAAGVCEAVVNAVKTHPTNVKVAEDGCWAISHLVNSCADSKSRLLALGVNDVLQAIKQQHKENPSMMHAVKYARKQLRPEPNGCCNTM